MSAEKQSATQHQVFSEAESWNYFQRNYGGQDLRAVPLHPFLEETYTHCAMEPCRSILELGCSAATNLFQSYRRFKAERGVGTEPSEKLVAHLQTVYPELEFTRSISWQLPFAANEFDLVIIRSVLHWIDREYLLQTVGEALRVCRRYLVVSDFSPHRPYSVPYHHDPRCLTFKMSYRRLIEASGMVRCIYSAVHDSANEYDVIETAVLEKLPAATAFPLQRQEDFR